MSDINWEELKIEFETSDISLKDLADKYGISGGTVRSRKNRDKWQRNIEHVATKKATQQEDKKGVATLREVSSVVTVEPKRDDFDLTDLQWMFANEYPVDLNATKAAIRAGYSEKTARVQACQLLTMPKIQDAIKQVMADRAKRLQITQDRVLEEYAKIAFADIKDYVIFDTVKTITGHDENGRPIIDYKTIVELKPSEQVDGRVISEVSISKDGTLKFKLHDKKGALDSVGKHLGMFIEKHEHTGKEGGPIEFSNARERLLGRISSLSARRGEAENTQRVN